MQWCDLLAFKPEQSGGVGSIPDGPSFKILEKFKIDMIYFRRVALWQKPFLKGPSNKKIVIYVARYHIKLTKRNHNIDHTLGNWKMQSFFPMYRQN